MVKVTVKWSKKVFNELEINTSGSVEDFKKKLYELTGVPVDRQKLMAKGVWKGILRDDENLSNLNVNDGTQIMLMGSAEVMTQPQEKVVFVEDMSVEEIAQTGVSLPSGLLNLGNTCYMNSTLQCLRYIPELRQSLKAFRGDISPDLSQSLVASLRDAYNQLDNSLDSIPPIAFVDILRRSFPQFAQRGQNGAFMQQDSDEFLQTLFSTLSQQLKEPHGFQSFGDCSNMIDALCGIKMEEILTCCESDQEPPVVKTEKVMKLVCNISKDTNHLSEGIKLGLEGNIEKHSTLLGRNAVWKKSSKIHTLPRYVCVQFMRFYWKATPDSQDHAGVKCKMLRPIAFPMNLDLFEFCSKELQTILSVPRAKQADEILNEFKEEKTDDVPMTPADEAEKIAMEEAMALSLGQTRPAGLGLSYNFQGLYELFAVVTHKGRSADSGHYIAWVREKEDDWLCFDDDSVSSCKSEDIEKLKGGGDWHMSYLAFYRAKQ